MTTTERPSSLHIRSLDGYRGIAFLLVFARHYTLTSHVSSPLVALMSRLGVAGWIGVDLFFVLSGFLITGILLDTVHEPHYFRNFMARRALRIFPLYYGVLFVILLLTPLLHLQWHRGHIFYFFYLGNVIANVHSSLEYVTPYFCFLHLWSLSLEEQFYLLWPLVIFFAVKSGRVVQVCLAASLISLLIRFALLHWLPAGTAFEWASAELPTRADGLLYGAIIAVWTRRFPAAQMARAARVVLAVAGLALMAIFIRLGGNFTHPVTTLFGYPLVAVFFSALLLLAIVPGSMTARFGSLGPLRTLGRYSYGLYVYHLIASPAMGRLLPVIQTQVHSVLIGGILFTILVFVTSLVVSVASYELYERDFLRLKRYFQYGPQPQPASAAIQSPR